MAAFGPKLAQTYGQAEAPMAITCLQPDEHDRIGVGRPALHAGRGAASSTTRTAPLPPGEEARS